MKCVPINSVYKSYILGHELYYSGKDMNNNRYLPRDKRGRFISEKKLKCPRCKEHAAKDGHDPCISNLPGVSYACCGHGVEKGYIAFKNGVIIRGNFEVERTNSNE